MAAYERYRVAKKKHSRLRLVGSDDPTSVFDDLDALRRAQIAPAAPAFQGQRRQRSVETFARIPHDRARRLYHLSGPAWALLIELDRLILEGRGRNPVRLTTKTLKASGLSEKRKRSGLVELEAAGVITVERQRGRSPLVTHLWVRNIALNGRGRSP
jgi:hypothetical protein